MSFVVVRDVSKVYRTDDAAVEARVLAGINMEVREGEFVSLMGPSGSGKSTLLTVIGAMNRPSSGELIIDGIDVYGLSEERRADFRREYLGFIFQQHHLMPYLNAVENVMLPLAVLSMPGKEKRERAMTALGKVGLGGKAARLPSQLSGGEQGRLAIARAIVNEPPLLLADEPTGTLDTKTGDEVMRVFLDLNASGQTVFMVTHNSEKAALCHRVLYIRDGRLTPEAAASHTQGSAVEELLAT